MFKNLKVLKLAIISLSIKHHRGKYITRFNNKIFKSIVESDGVVSQIVVDDY